MKRFMGWMMLIMLLAGVLSTACADEFTLRNGIRFNDTMDEVLSKETEPFATIDREGGMLKTEEGQISNIYGTSVDFHFEEDQLYAMYYRYPAFKLDWATAGCYELINEALVEKYGRSLSGRAAESVIQSGCFTADSLIAYLSGGSVCQGDEWLIEYSDYSVKIEHIYYYNGATEEYEHDLSYVLITDDEIQSREEEKQKNKDQLGSQL